MYNYIIAHRGESAYVVKLSDNVYSLVSEYGCHFSKHPDSFYKFGYYEQAENISSEVNDMVIKLLKKDVDALNEENWYQFCSGVKSKDVKEAFSEFIKSLKEM